MKRFFIRCGVVLFLSMALLAALALVPPEGAEPESGTGFHNGVIRFHVIAASDNPRDQELKLKVRDAVLDYLRPELSGARDDSDAFRVIKKELPQIQAEATDTLRAAGCTDRVRVSFGIYDFPARAYGPVVFPAGSYRSLRIVLGDGDGRNWWCCLFPPLCYVDLTRSARDLAGQEDLCPRSEQADLPGDRAVFKGRKGGRPLLTTKIGEWLDDSRPPAMLSWIWKRRT